MSATAADVLVDSLIDWGVEVVFGMPGDGVNGVIEAFRKQQKKIRFIQVRHEESAALMATGYAKWTGRLGVCVATSGPGGIHLLNGLYDAKLDGAPVLAITGLQYHDLLGAFSQQDVALDKLFMDVAVFNERIMGPAHVENIVELACRAALARRGPAHVTIPVDVQSAPVKKAARSKRNVEAHVSDVMAYDGGCPDEGQLRRAAEILNSGSRTFILAGHGALRARGELEEVADILAAPVGTALLGKGATEDGGRYSTGGVGLLGTRPSQDAMAGCDTLLIVGSTFPYIEFYPKPGKARAVQVDRDPVKIGLRCPVEAGLVGDSARTLRALIPLLRRREDRSFLHEAQEGMRAWAKLMEERGTRRDLPMKPQVVVHELNRLLADDAIVATDSGTVTTWTARHVDMRRQRRFACSGMLATMACGLPYAIAAAIAFPGRQVVAVIGDGSAAMLLGELATLSKYDLDVKLVVVRNDTLGMIKWEQIVFLGNPEYVCELEPIDFAKAAEACGVRGLTIADPARCAEQLEDALETPGPCLIQAIVDPNEPPMPPKVTVEQAVHLAEALAKGTPGGGRIIKTIARDKAREII
jgi:pyruvate dehydrogenase (quinone)/pyruvate oxidase